jgi:flagellar hook-associated protein 3 FlgL
MRVTESRMMELAAQAVSDAMSKSASTGQIVASGIRVNLPSDDPAAWAAGMRAEARKTLSTFRSSAIGSAQERLTTSEDALAGISKILSQVKVLGVQAGNDTLSATDRATTAVQARGLQQSLLALLNTRDASGQYVFAGTLGNTAAFDPTGAFVGNAVDRVVQVGEGQTEAVSISGSALTAASGVDVYAAVDALAKAMENNDAAGVRAQLDTMNKAISQVASATATAGIKLKALSDADTSRVALEQNLDHMTSSALAADPTTSASDFTNAKNALDAAQLLAQQIVSLTTPH